MIFFHLFDADPEVKSPLFSQLQRVLAWEARTENRGGRAGQSGRSDKLSTSCWLTLQRLFLSREEVEISSVLFYFFFYFFKESQISQWQSQMIKSHVHQASLSLQVTSRIMRLLSSIYFSLSNKVTSSLLLFMLTYASAIWHWNYRLLVKILKKSISWLTLSVKEVGTNI